MKKQVQFLAVLSTAAVMTAVAPGAFQAIPGFAQNVYAASKAGWTEEDGELRYLDSDGYPITDAWKKKDNDWYYLNDDGVIARSQMVDEYYVDEDGKRIYNQWNDHRYKSFHSYEYVSFCFNASCTLSVHDLSGILP